MTGSYSFDQIEIDHQLCGGEGSLRDLYFYQGRQAVGKCNNQTPDQTQTCGIHVLHGFFFFNFFFKSSDIYNYYSVFTRNIFHDILVSQI